MPTRKHFTAPDGRALSYWVWPAQTGKPWLHFAHATGFNARVYSPLLNELAGHFNLLAWDARGHGDSAAAGVLAEFDSWERYYADMVALLDHIGEPMLLAGHSFGGTTSMVAASRRPDQVQGLLLIDPVLMDRRQGLLLRLARWLNQSARHPLAAGAARRREQFASRAQLWKAWHGRKAFKTWQDEWLQAYIDHGFADVADGIRLTTPRAWESASFAHTDGNVWPAVKTLRCPLKVLLAEQGTTCSASSQRRLRKLQLAADLHIVPNSTHFLPMEKPDAVLAAFRSYR